MQELMPFARINLACKSAKSDSDTGITLVLNAIIILRAIMLPGRSRTATVNKMLNFQLPSTNLPFLPGRASLSSTINLFIEHSFVIT